MTARAIRRWVGRSLAGSTITAMSLASRVLALLLLVPAARVLTVDDFGVFSLALGLAVASANVAGSAPADLTAAAANRDPVGTRARVLRVVVASTALGAVLVCVCTVWEVPFAVVGLTTAVGLSVVGPMLAMHVLRGLDRPVLGAALPYLAVPLARCVAAGTVLWLPVDLDGLLALVAASGVIVGLATIGVLLAATTTTTAPPPHTGPGPRRRGLAFLAGAAVSASWLLVGQTAVVALSVAAGPAAVAAYVPTARICESLTAIGIGYKFVTTRQLVEARDGTVPRRAVLTLLGLVAAGGAVVSVLAPGAVPALFGSELRFLPVPALALVAAAGVASVVSVKLQALFAARQYRRVLLATCASIVVTIVVVALGTALLGVDGAALGTATAFLTWLLLLSVRSRTRRERTSPC